MKPNFDAFSDSEGNSIKVITTKEEFDDFLKKSKEAFNKLPFWNRFFWNLLKFKNKIL